MTTRDYLRWFWQSMIRQRTTDAVQNCRSEEGITVGLVDAIISILRVLAPRDLSTKNVQEALADLSEDPDFWTVAAANERAKTAEAERDRYASAYHRLDSDQAAAGSYAMRAERAEDERDKARARLAELGRPIRDRIEAKIRPAMLFGLQDAELYGEPGAQRIGEWVDWIADTLTEADSPTGPGAGLSNTETDLKEVTQ